MKSKIVAAAAAIAFGLTMIATPVVASDKATFDSAFSAADSARKGAAKVGYEWRDTGKMLKKAKALAKKGNFAKAVKLANAAKFQGERAQAQAGEQANLWQSFVLK